MATITSTLTVTGRDPNTGQQATIRCSMAWTYAQTNGDAATTISASKLQVFQPVVSGTNATAIRNAEQALDRLLSNTYNLKFDGKTVASRSNLTYGTTYTVSGSASVNRTTTNQTKTLAADGGGTASITVPALQSWAITYNANSGSGAPAQQTKYYGININLQGGIPTKTGYTFKGWASSEANAKAGIVNYNPSQTYSDNAALSLWAVWEITYSKPIITNFRVERCDANGNLDDDGNYAKAVFHYAIFKSPDARYYGGSTAPYANNDVASCAVTVGTETATPTMIDGVGTAIVGNGSFNPDDAYNASVELTDTQQIVADHTSTAVAILSAAYFPMDYNRDATAVGFFMPAPDNKEGVFLGKDLFLSLDTTAGSGDDYDIYTALDTLGWARNVIV